MAPIPLKSIASVSSEDALNPASNLLSPVPGGKWLCAAANKTRTAEVVLELAKRARIIGLEICNFGSAFVEVLVSDSSSPDQCVTLLPVSMLMSSVESRSGRNKNKMAIYGKDKLSIAATSRKWNRVNIRCIQKYDKDSQFGLRAVSFFTESRDPGPGAAADRAMTSPLLHRPVVTTPPSSSTPRQELSQSSQRRQKLLPTPWSTKSDGATPRDGSRLKWTPSRRSSNVKSEGSEKDFEFSGIEKQSRLFHSCMQRKPEDSDGAIKGSNQILDRISADKDKYRGVLSPQYSRKKLLKRELPKAEVMKDFIESYKERKASSELAGACRKMSSHDNDYEIGEEPESTWGWNKFTGKPKRLKSSAGGRRKKGRNGDTGWLSKRKKLSSMIEHCSDVLSKAGAVGDGGGGGGTTLEEDVSSTEEEIVTEEELECGKVGTADKDVSEVEDGNYADACPISEGGDHDHASSVTAAAFVECPCGDHADTAAALVECPLCSSFFPSYAIEVHASQCGEEPPATPHSHSLSTGIITID